MFMCGNNYPFSGDEMNARVWRQKKTHPESKQHIQNGSLAEEDVRWWCGDRRRTQEKQIMVKKRQIKTLAERAVTAYDVTNVSFFLFSTHKFTHNLTYRTTKLMLVHNNIFIMFIFLLYMLVKQFIIILMMIKITRARFHYLRFDVFASRFTR